MPTRFQCRIDHYLILRPKPTPSGLTIFDVPYHIRCYIYTYAGLIHERPIELNYTRASEDEEQDFTPNDPDHSDRENLPSQLLYVSRAVSNEVSSILYARSRFTISRSKPSGLSALHSLGAHSLGLITFLFIRLNARGSCSGKARCGCGSFNCCGQCLCAVGDQLLGRVTRHDRSVISEWKTLCQRMAAHVQQSHLKLCLICDMKDENTTHDILQLLMAMRTLRACSIRVSHTPDRELRRLAATATLRLTGRATATPLTRFATLPQELQRRILEHTDLVAPYDLEWDPESGFACDSRVEDSDSCAICAQVRESCCTPLTNGAFASQCGCWRFPIALFSVSRTFRTEAMRIFYSGNHFSILPYGGRVDSFPWGRRLELSPFIMSLPLDALKHLRSLQFVFRDSHNFLLPDSQASHDWTQTIDLLSRSADLSRLSLTIDVSCGRADFDSYIDFRGMEQEAWAAYQRLVEPMVDRLRGLKDLFVHLSWPMYSFDSAGNRKQHEQILEQRIMGKKYDSVLRGKFCYSTRWTHG